jgi:casein kinase 1
MDLLSKQQIAIKFEPRKSDAPQLRDEYKTYKIMAGTGKRNIQNSISISSPFFLIKSSLVGVPKAYYFGQEGLHNVMVIDLLGPSLEDMFDMCGRKFSVKTVCMLAMNMVILILK